MPEPEVVIYTKHFCPFCTAAKRLLNEKKVNYQEINVGGNQKLRSEIAEKSGQLTVPQIFIGDRSIGGFQELQALDQNGELDQILGQK